jgi:hypothetical protein
MAGALRVNDVIHLDERAGIQFRFRPITVLVTRILDDLPGRAGIWIAGYELVEEAPGRRAASTRRELYIPNVDGIRYADRGGESSVDPPPRLRRTAGAAAG